VFVFFILLITNEITTFSTNTLTTWSCIAGALYIGRHYAIRSGGCLNPGVALGMQIVSVVMDHETYVFKRTWVYAIGPFLGGFLAGKMFDRYLKEFHRARKPEKEDEI
jgi:glycerol uptake facilitator-like aquaporin